MDAPLTDDRQSVILLLPVSETSDAGAAAGGGGGEDAAAGQGDEPGDQGSHRGTPDRERPPHQGDCHSQGDHQGKLGVRGSSKVSDWGESRNL